MCNSMHFTHFHLVIRPWKTVINFSSLPNCCWMMTVCRTRLLHEMLLKTLTAMMVTVMMTTVAVMVMHRVHQQADVGADVFG